jgi:phosphoribosylanthranilate isomerase
VADGLRALRGRGWSLSVDVSSGVEAAKGIKDPQKINAFVQAVRQA